jgi:hypothetical protein
LRALDVAPAIASAAGKSAPELQAIGMSSSSVCQKPAANTADHCAPGSAARIATSRNTSSSRATATAVESAVAAKSTPTKPCAPVMRLTSHAPTLEPAARPMMKAASIALNA